MSSEDSNAHRVLKQATTRYDAALARCKRNVEACIERYGQYAVWPKGAYLACGYPMTALDQKPKSQWSHFNKLPWFADKEDALLATLHYNSYRKSTLADCQLADQFPDLIKHHRLPRLGEDDDEGNLKRYLRALDSIDSDSNPGVGGGFEVLYWCMYDALKDKGQLMFPPVTFDRIIKELADEADAAQKAEPKPAGRKPSDVTRAVELIRESLGVSRRSAYRIFNDGTSVVAYRRVLADTFADDPTRNKPGAWEPFDGSRGRWHTVFDRITFRRYVESGVDQFEGDRVSDVLAVLADAYRQGFLPSHFQNSGALLRTVQTERLPVELPDVLPTWDAYQRWRALRKLDQRAAD